MPKRPNPMSVNKVLTYTAEAAATALGVTTATVRSYIRRGLPVMSSQRPYLISGEALREFLIEERAAKKVPLKPNELYCPSCRRGRRPFGLLVDLAPLTAKTGLLKGLCERCEGPSNRMIAYKQLTDFTAIFNITKGGCYSLIDTIPAPLTFTY